MTMTVLLLMAILSCSACGAARSGSIHTKEGGNAAAAANAANQAAQEEAQSTADLPNTKENYYMITKHDSYNRQITLMALTGGEPICYEYTDGTEFFDKYGNYTLSEDFSEGKLAVIERLNSNDTLGAIAFTDETWDYEDVKNYTVDAEKSRIDIADTAYRLDEEAKVFSEGEETELYAIGDSDILNIYGIGRTVYSIVIKTGHGTLSLTNTDLFEGGWVNLGTKVYAKITKDMTMELPEGDYEFAVANDGYGDSGQVRIRRDMVTTIDLNDYKGEGPKLCKVTFDVGVSGAILTINGKKVNHKKPMELRYGIYTLGVYAEGYDAWTKQLVVNSPKAKIEILLSAQADGQTDSGSDTAQSSDTKKESSTKNESTKQIASNKSRNLAGSKAGSYTGNSSSSGGTDSSSVGSALANAALSSSLASIITGGDSTDYLDTLSGLVDSLDRLSGSRGNRSENTDSED
ncbi:MAG: hypothetical protein K2N87_18065 [Eubacterium sp.]|nr:hypothetical protein [Eubacterium sp.]